MREELAQELTSILDNGNFTSQVKNDVLIKDKTYKSVLVIEHDEISAELACQHIQEFINDDIDFKDGEWLLEYSLELVSSLNTLVSEDKTILY
jgi:hypothetical protein